MSASVDAAQSVSSRNSPPLTRRYGVWTVAAATLAASLILAYSKSDLRAVEGWEEVAGIAVAQSFGAVDASVAAATVALVGLGGAVVWLIEKLREARVR